MKGSEPTSYVRNPRFILGLFLIVSVTIGYLLLSYNWENKDLLTKYQTTSSKLKTASLRASKYERSLRLCRASETSIKESNRDLQHKGAQQDNQIAAISKQKDDAESKLRKSHQFYLEVKDIVDKGEDESMGDLSDNFVSDETYNGIKAILNQWKVERGKQDTLQKEFSALKKEKEEIKSQLEQVQSDSQGKDQKIEKLNGDLSNQKEELESLKLDQRRHGINRKNFGRHKNVRQEDLNERHIDEATSPAEDGVKDISNKPTGTASEEMTQRNVPSTNEVGATVEEMFPRKKHSIRRNKVNSSDVAVTIKATKADENENLNNTLHATEVEENKVLKKISKKEGKVKEEDEKEEEEENNGEENEENEKDDSIENEGQGKSAESKLLHDAVSPSPLSNTGLLNNSSQKLSNVTSLRNNTQSLGNETQSERSYNGNTTTSTTFHVKSQEVKTEVNKVISTTEASEELLSDNDLEDEDATYKFGN